MKKRQGSMQSDVKRVTSKDDRINADGFIGISPGSVYTFIAAGIGAFLFIFLGRLRAISR